ncbi:MAG: hypothetical protein ACI9EP_001747 [Oceanospirillaceae bacterium]|jgi:hypothetical protein
MNELTDLEICKRIAEIEGEKDKIEAAMMAIRQSSHHPIFATGTVTSHQTFDDIYNPLTDDALCLQLIDKYNVSINTHFWDPSIKQCYIIRLVGFEMVTGKTFSINDLGLKKAACLAIIDSKA